MCEVKADINDKSLDFVEAYSFIESLTLIENTEATDTKDPINSKIMVKDNSQTVAMRVIAIIINLTHKHIDSKFVVHLNIVDRVNYFHNFFLSVWTNFNELIGCCGSVNSTG